MSEENVEILRRANEAFQRGDLAGMVENMAEECVCTRVAPLPDVKAYHGPAGFLQFLLDWVEGFDDFTGSVEEFIVVGNDQVLARVRQTGIGVHSRVPTDGEFWFLYTFRDGKTVRLEIYAEKAQAL
jgi:ketosteroid isomerase-like protein